MRPKGNKKKVGQGIKLLSPSAGLSFTNDTLVLPMEQRLRQTVAYIATLPSATLTAGVTGVGTVFGNSAYQPFESTPKFDSATGFLTPVNGSDTLALPGYATFLPLYNSARTTRSRIRVSCVPGSSGDQMILCVFAASAADVAALTLPCSLDFARQQKGFREAFCYVGNRLKENTVECQMNSHEVLGLTQQQYMDQPPTVVISTAPPATTVDWRWVVQYFTGDGALNAANIVFRIEVAYDNLYSVPIPVTH